MQHKTLLAALLAALPLVAAQPATAATALWEGQSPIDLPAALAPEKEALGLSFHYQPEDLVLTNTYQPGGGERRWATLRAGPADGAKAFKSTVEYKGERYVLAQFHFHTPSEHTVGGKPADAEVHFVHLRLHANGDPYCIGEPQSLLVVGALIREGAGATRGEWARLASAGALPADAGAAAVSLPGFHLERALPAASRTWRYNGGLTAPASVDCSKPLLDLSGHAHETYHPGHTVYNSPAAEQLADGGKTFPETVHWFVLEKPLVMSHETVAALRAAMGANARAVQDGKGRKVRMFRAGAR